ncbi:MAG: efflux RND transporter periplasmic adaptor subunit [Bacteroidetes bacterium]|nr:efflux RND transporter periplasmic adaptor subunit [Bacteroidota bacterium]
MTNQFKLYSIATIIFSVLLFSCKDKEPENTAPKKVCISDTMSKSTKIDTATINSMSDELKLSGEINFDDKKVTKVFAFSSGQVIKVNVSVGDKVSRGQVLAIIKSADIAGNYSDLSTAGNDVAIAKKALDNTESLYKNGIASEREYIEAKENYQRAVTSAAKIKSQITINGGGRTSENGTYVITAPQTGYVVEKKISEGGFIRSDASDNLFTIGDISEVWVWANVYETDIAKVKEGYDAAITTLAYPDKVFHGKVDEVYNVLDPVTKVMKIKIRLENKNQELKPEMFANISITNPKGEKELCIPKEAVLPDGAKNFVVLYNSNCDLKIREIQILKTIDDNTFIKSGLADGDKVLGSNQILFYKALQDQQN